MFTRAISQYTFNATFKVGVLEYYFSLAEVAEQTILLTYLKITQKFEFHNFLPYQI